MILPAKSHSLIDRVSLIYQSPKTRKCFVEISNILHICSALCSAHQQLAAARTIHESSQFPNNLQKSRKFNVVFCFPALERENSLVWVAYVMIFWININGWLLKNSKPVCLTRSQSAFRDSGAQISSSFFLDAILHSCVATIRETNHERTTLKVKAAVNGLINVK